jgi:hypothetical protein
MNAISSFVGMNGLKERVGLRAKREEVSSCSQPSKQLVVNMGLKTFESRSQAVLISVRMESHVSFILKEHGID